MADDVVAKQEVCALPQAVRKSRTLSRSVSTLRLSVSPVSECKAPTMRMRSS